MIFTLLRLRADASTLTVAFCAGDIVPSEVVTIWAGTQTLSCDTPETDVGARVFLADVDTHWLSVLMEHVHHFGGLQLKGTKRKLG